MGEVENGTSLLKNPRDLCKRVAWFLWLKVWDSVINFRQWESEPFSLSDIPEESSQAGIFLLSWGLLSIFPSPWDKFHLHFFSSFVEIQSMHLWVTHLKCTVPWLSFYSQSCIAVTSINFRTFSSHQTETMRPLAVTPDTPCPPSHSQLLIHFLSL